MNDSIQINGEDSKMLNIVRGTLFSFPTGLRMPPITIEFEAVIEFETLGVTLPSG